MDKPVQKSNYTDTDSNNQKLEDHLRMVDADLGNLTDYAQSLPQAKTTPAIFTGTASPTTTPRKIGDMFIDTTNHKIYVADGIASSTNWRLLN